MEPMKNVSTVDERLDAALLRDLQNDLRFLMNGDGVFLFAVDAFDVLRYCFPIGSSVNAIRVGDLERQADYFAALSFVMHQNQWRPILLPEYLAEVYGFSAGLIAEYGRQRIGDRQLQKAIEHEVEALIPDIPESPKPSEAVEYMKEYFPLVLLLAAAGTAQLGLRELGHLVQRRLVSLGTLPDSSAEPDDDVWSFLGKFSRQYKPNTKFVNRCYAAFGRLYDVKLAASKKRSSPANDRADAVALDQVLQMNQILRQAHKDGILTRPHTVRLLSSSVRLRMLLDEICREPGWEDSTYSLENLRVVRVPDQIFAFVIAHPSGPSRAREDILHTEEVLETIKWLVELHEKAETLKDDVRSNARVRNEMQQGLELLQTHRRRILAPYQNSYENLALFSRMREPLSKALDLVTTKGRGQNSTSPPALLRIQGLVDVEDLESAAREALDIQRHLVRVHTILAHRWCIGLSKGSSLRLTTTASDDYVYGAYHALPWMIHITDVNLAFAVLKTREAFFSHPDDVQLRREALADAFERLVKYDTSLDPEPEASAEADLVRAVALLALHDGSSEKAASALARSIRNSGPHRLTVDALYVEVWAERRMGHFQRAAELASRAIERDRNDARFWHGRALARFGRIMSRDGNLFEYVGIQEDLETALRLYRETAVSSPDLQTVMIAGCLNSLTYIHALAADSQSSSTARNRHLESARQCLIDLKGIMAPGDWIPRYPEFFHTEGFLELQESKRLIGSVRAEKLRCALEAAAHAARLAPMRPGHRELYEEIVQILQEGRQGG